MKKILLSAILLGFIVSKSLAQANVGSKLSIGPEIGIPLGQANQVYNLVEGGSIKFETPVASNIDITLTAGFENFSAKSYFADYIESGQYIPIELGVKNYFPSSPLYVEIDFGASLNINSNYTGSQAAFLYAPIIGVSVPTDKKNSIDFGVRYEGRVETGGTVSQLALRVAYKFGLK